MKFDFIIGNPPYQEEVENNGRKNPIYAQFMEASNALGTSVELITPARFLFNAGQTSKSWNQKLLNDEHFKVINYYDNASDVFPNTDIKGGVAITYHDVTKQYEPIKIFTNYDEMNSITQKVNSDCTLSSIVFSGVSYRFSNILKAEHPEYVSLIGKEFDLRTNVFNKLNGLLFFDEYPNDGLQYAKIFGLYNKKRAWKWIALKYLETPENYNSYKVSLPKSNGAGSFGETLSSPIVCKPGTGTTQSFISIGSFNSENEAEALLKYIKSKFSRSLLGLLKKTQDNAKAVWRMIPLQDFTSSSDIDWSQSIHNIDQQLYKKYNLDQSEINFIETHVKEME